MLAFAFEMLYLCGHEIYFIHIDHPYFVFGNCTGHGYYYGLNGNEAWKTYML